MQALVNEVENGDLLDVMYGEMVEGKFEKDGRGEDSSRLSKVWNCRGE